MIETIKLTKDQYETLLFLSNGQTIFNISELYYEPFNRFMGENIDRKSNTDVIHFVK